MNLLRFNFTYNPNYIFINNLELKPFLNLFKINSSIELIQFYGVNKEIQVDENGFDKFLTIGQFVKKVDQLGDLRINNIIFKIEELQIDIMDCMEYNISSMSLNISELLNKILRELLFSDFKYIDLRKYEEIYLLFDKGKIINTFSSFDDYLSFDTAPTH